MARPGQYGSVVSTTQPRQPKGILKTSRTTESLTLYYNPREGAREAAREEDREGPVSPEEPAAGELEAGGSRRAGEERPDSPSLLTRRPGSPSLLTRRPGSPSILTTFQEDFLPKR